jgi:hypothetical protein
MLSYERRHPPDELSYHKRQMGGESIAVGSFLLLEDDDGSETSILLLEDDAGAEVSGLFLEDQP